MRISQYIKNGFIFLPLFFALELTNLSLVISAVVAFSAFSLASSGVYILNDIQDIREDQKHPQKKHRPLASGEITKTQAIGMVVTVWGACLAISLTHSLGLGLVILGYMAMGMAYTYLFKFMPIVDVGVIAVGFVLRLVAGSVSTGISLSMWIVVMTFLLALFLALAKRRDDVLIFLNTGEKMRKSLHGYTLKFLDISMSVMASAVIVAYVLYTISPDVVERTHSEYLYVTALFVVMGVLRYLQITFVDENSGSPTAIVLKDTFMQLTLIGWIISFAAILY